VFIDGSCVLQLDEHSFLIVFRTKILKKAANRCPECHIVGTLDICMHTNFKEVMK